MPATPAALATAEARAETRTPDALCSDGLDNDGDTFTDCLDFDCGDTVSCILPSESSNPACSDGVDNDRNRFTDCC